MAINQSDLCHRNSADCKLLCMQLYQTPPPSLGWESGSETSRLLAVQVCYVVQLSILALCHAETVHSYWFSSVDKIAITWVKRSIPLCYGLECIVCNSANNFQTTIQLHMHIPVDPISMGDFPCACMVYYLKHAVWLRRSTFLTISNESTSNWKMVTFFQP